MQAEFWTQRRKNAPSIITSRIKFKQAEIINIKKLSEDLAAEMFVLPIFLPPGKNDLMIRTAQDRQTRNKGSSEPLQDLAFRWYYSRLIIRVREEHFPVCTK